MIDPAAASFAASFAAKAGVCPVPMTGYDAVPTGTLGIMTPSRRVPARANTRWMICCWFTGLPVAGAGVTTSARTSTPPAAPAAAGSSAFHGIWFTVSSPRSSFSSFSGPLTGVWFRHASK